MVADLPVYLGRTILVDAVELCRTICHYYLAKSGMPVGPGTGLRCYSRNAASGHYWSLCRCDSLAILPSTIGLLFAGLIAEKIGITNTFIISGGLVMLTGLLAFGTPALKRLKQ